MVDALLHDGRRQRESCVHGWCWRNASKRDAGATRDAAGAGAMYTTIGAGAGTLREQDDVLDDLRWCSVGHFTIATGTAAVTNGTDAVQVPSTIEQQHEGLSGNSPTVCAWFTNSPSNVSGKTRPVKRSGTKAGRSRRKLRRARTPRSARRHSCHS